MESFVGCTVRKVLFYMYVCICTCMFSCGQGSNTELLYQAPLGGEMYVTTECLFLLVLGA